MEEWDDVFRELADHPSEFERQGSLVTLVRQGEDHILELKEVPGVGLSVPQQGPSERFIPIATYLQRELLGLPRLASQIVRAVERSEKARPVQFIEGPAEFEVGGRTVSWDAASSGLQSALLEAEAGSTQIIQLMAAAGRGKTVLLEHAAKALARSYQPDPFPTPILLPVDLLGRYVGTIEDAIAGSLNNTYVFPKLSQRDVALCIRKRWLVLALDGFDELVARVGARDAFLRITELLEQLRASGTVILSARESFFELYQISAAIRSYLQPKRGGNYSTSIVRFLPWARRQGIGVFAALGSTDPEGDFDGLRDTFDGDDSIVLHPFFLTRLADLWRKGERFAEAGGHRAHLARTKYVIDTFILRESGEKWINRDNNTALLTPEQHTALLGGIAEEMWRSGAFMLDADELRLAAEIGITGIELAPSVRAEVLEKAPLHAAIVNRERRYTFVHERFLHFYLGVRLRTLLVEQGSDSLVGIFGARELGPEILEWLSWDWQRSTNDLASAVEVLTKVRSESDDPLVAANCGHVCAAILDRASDSVLVGGLSFVGEAMTSRRFTQATFSDCQFWHLDLSGTEFASCRFEECQLGDIHLDDSTDFRRSSFRASPIASLEMESGYGVFAPAEIAEELERRGAVLLDREQDKAKQVYSDPSGPVRFSVDKDLVDCVSRLLRASEKTCDVAVDDLEEMVDPGIAKVVVRAGLETGVLRDVVRQTSGPRKTFVRFNVARAKILPALRGAQRDRVIEDFWRVLQSQ